MRFALVGRTEILISCGEALAAAGHEPALVVSCKEAPEYSSTVEDFQALAKNWSVPFVRTTKADTIVATVAQLPPIDICISINFAGILPQAAISAFRLGILNAHGGNLPRYRGNACQAWAILNGESHAGLCVHRMIGGELDSGDIVAHAEREIGDETTVGMLWDWMSETTPKLMADAVEVLARDPDFFLRRQSREIGDALRCYPRLPEDGRIVWQDSARSILRLIRASGRPYSGAFCVLDGNVLTVWEADSVDDGECFLAIPGQVTAIKSDSVEVATGDGKIALRLVSTDGGEVGSPARLVTSLRTRLR